MSQRVFFASNFLDLRRYLREMIGVDTNFLIFESAEKMLVNGEHDTRVKQTLKFIINTGHL